MIFYETNDFVIKYGCLLSTSYDKLLCNLSPSQFAYLQTGTVPVCIFANCPGDSLHIWCFRRVLSPKKAVWRVLGPNHFFSGSYFLGSGAPLPKNLFPENKLRIRLVELWRAACLCCSLCCVCCALCCVCCAS